MGMPDNNDNGNHKELDYEFPEVVRIRHSTIFPFVNNSERKPVGACDGTIINNNWILTSGHCCFDRDGRTLPPYTISIAVGAIYDDTHSSDKNPITHDEGLAGIKFTATNVVTHPKYSNTDDVIMWDFCLLQVQEDMLKNNEYASAVQFPAPTSGDPHSNVECVVVGWGESADRLLANVELHDGICDHKAYGEEFCVGLSKTGTIKYIGDGGGPLFCQQEDRIYKQYGMVSSGKLFGSTDEKFIYTKTDGIRDWIRQVMKHK